MGETTNKEHYISRAMLLRRFSDTMYNDDSKNRLFCFDKATHHIIKSNVADLAHKHRIYEDPAIPLNSIEKYLAKQESIWTPFLDRLIAICTNHQNHSALVLHGERERDILVTIMMTQYFRTLGAKKALNRISSKMGIRENKVFTQLLSINLDTGNPWVHVFTLEMMDCIFIFDINATGTPFVLGDNPVRNFCKDSEIDNDAYCFVLPLTPWFAIILCEARSQYFQEFKPYRNRIRRINDLAYVKDVNRLSYDGADRFVFYTPDINFEWDEQNTNFLLVTESTSKVD